MHSFEKKKYHWQWVLWDLKSIVMMQTPTVIVTQPLDLMKMISREQLSDSRDMGFVHSFRLESVLESTKKEQLAAVDVDVVESALRDVNLSSGRETVLKSEQESAVRALLANRDVLAVLRTGYGKFNLPNVCTRKEL